MADFKFSTGLQKAFLSKKPFGVDALLTNTAEFISGQIIDPGKLGAFSAGDFVRVMLGVNENVYAQVISGDSNHLSFENGTFTSAASGTYVYIEKIETGSISEIMKNGVIDVYGPTRRSSPDDSEGTAVLLARLTKGGLAFTPGTSENGINTQWSGSGLNRAIDPATGLDEDVFGEVLVDGTPSWACWRNNDAETGASTSAIRADGTCTTSSSATFYIDYSTTTAGKVIKLKSINIFSKNT